MFYQLIEKRIAEFDINKIIEDGFFNINYKNFFTDKHIIDPIQPNVQLEFVRRPQLYFNCIGLAMHQVLKFILYL